ncbi:MAG TPA: NAD(P)-dependent oxidoreductase [Propionibacteriaceae bacterium]|nr:NAD(P)-dependent oxidoreductase [Propionibacteriaceae bacterium]
MSKMSAGESVGVGVIGLGMMGLPMTANLLEHGDATVHITGRRQARYADLIDAGAVWHDNPRSLASEVGVLLLMLPDLPQVEEILSGPDGILAAQPEDLLLIISSSSSPVGVRELADRLSRSTTGAVRVVDAPVSGGVDGAEAGTLSIMVGGAERDVAQARAVLTACGNPVHLGPLGSGQVAKACNQMIVASTILALGEAAVLAERSGIDLGEMFRLLGGGYAGSRILETRGERIVTEDYSPSGVAKYMVKDLGFALAVAEATDTHVVLLPAVRAAFEELTAMGHGDNDIAVTRRYVSQR